jgi:transcriptional regulator with XRE-family HTH domain
LRGRFAQRLRQLRIRKYATQEQFQKALKQHGLKVNVNTISNWETGMRLPELNDWEKIGSALGVKWQSLLPPS